MIKSNKRENKIVQNKLTKFSLKLLDLVFPRHIKCVFCGDELNEKGYNDSCVNCMSTLPFIVHACPRCGEEIKENNSGVCFNCKSRNYNFENAKSVFTYEKYVKMAVHKFKYSNQTFLAEPFANFMIEELVKWDVDIDIITYVPMHLNKERVRGYNQAKLLADEISSKIKIPCLDLTSKVVEKGSQTSLSFEDRKENVKNTFRFNNNHKQAVKDKAILIVDDVFTTGATTSEIAGVLKHAGAKSVYVLTLAHTSLNNLC